MESSKSVSDLEGAISAISKCSPRASNRLDSLADYLKRKLLAKGLPDVKGGSGGELRIKGMARTKSWDVAYNFAGKDRLLISLKSIWKNAGGTVPNRIDDLMGEAANVQQMSPEIMVGYVLLFDSAADSIRTQDAMLWSDYFELAVRRVTVRRAPLWNQGLIEGAWFIKFDSRKPDGARLD